jgi:hypothetical protein
MPAFLIAAKLLFGGWLKAALAFLKTLSFWQIMFGAALILAGWQWIAKKAEQRHTHKVEKQLSKANDLINRLREESKKQQKQVGNVVDHYVTVTKPEVRERVRVIESAPLKGGCQTPDAVMEAGV